MAPPLIAERRLISLKVSPWSEWPNQPIAGHGADTKAVQWGWIADRFG
jgi:hypothetical protein